MSVNASNILLEKAILLESGTNEVEILVFRVGAYRLGINVAKVREILPSQQITHLPKAHSSIVGCFQLRDVVVPCVSLHRHLKQDQAENSESNLILTEFNDCQTAFIVDEVERIHRVSWEQILPAPSTVTAVASPVTAVTNLENRLVILLDFESINAEISEDDHSVVSIDNTHNVPRDELRILVADDSATIRMALQTTLSNSGFSEVVTFEHGQQAWNWLNEQLERTQDVREIADAIISDVEMPAMDGLNLTRRIKEHPVLNTLPVVLYSSIATPDNFKKGEMVGADAQISKPELGKVVQVIDDLTMKSRSQQVQPRTTEQPEPALASS